MLHHTRRWNRDHAEELHSAWLNGVGDARLGERLRRLGRLERARQGAAARDAARSSGEYAELLATGEWTPLAAHSGGVPPQVVASRWTDGETTLWALANGGDGRSQGRWSGRPRGELPPRGIAAFVGSEQVMVRRRRDAAFPARDAGAHPGAASRALDGGARRLRRGRRPRRRGRPPSSAAARRGPTARRPTSRSGSRCRRGCTTSSRSSATPSPRRASRSRVARSQREFGVDGPPDEPVTGLDLAEARAYAASVGARLPTEDEWQLAAEAGLLERAEPLVWNWTESEHTRRSHALRDPQGRLGLGRRGVGVVRRRRPAGAALLAEAAAARRRARALAANRLSPGGRPA